MKGQAIVLPGFGKLREDGDCDRRFIGEQINRDRAQSLHHDASAGARQCADVRGWRERRNGQRGRDRLHVCTGARCQNRCRKRCNGWIAVAQLVAQQPIGGRISHLADPRQQRHARISHRHTAFLSQAIERADDSRQARAEIRRSFQPLRTRQHKAGVIAAQRADRIVHGVDGVDGDVRIRILHHRCKSGAVFQNSRDIRGPGANVPDRIGHHRYHRPLRRNGVDGGQRHQRMCADPPVASGCNKRSER